MSRFFEVGVTCASHAGTDTLRERDKYFHKVVV